MKLYNVMKTLGASALFMAALPALAAPSSSAMLIGYADRQAMTVNPQEATAASYFVDNIGGDLLTAADLASLDADKTKVLWIHIDRVGLGYGYANLPAEFTSPAVTEALKKYLADGGNIYLSKHATQMVAALGRLPEAWLPGIFGDGDGGAGTDVWTVNAHFGSMQFAQPEPDMTQVYDRRSHQIYAGLEVMPADSEWTPNYPHESFPMLGSGDGTPLHREDHNCMWDLNAYNNLYTVEGKNTLEKFEAEHNCTVLGTWGHVQDYCVAGIVDFEPAGDVKGRIVANGLAACEWAPREGVNAYHSNLEKLTGNILEYLGAKSGETAVEAVEVAEGASAWYTLQGVRVANPEAGIYIEVKDGKAVKRVVR